MESIGRSKRFIQNNLQLFCGLEDTVQYKIRFQEELHRYLAAHRGVVPEVRFYLDETGTEGDKAYTGVAGICIMNWKQYEKYSSALAEWRRGQAWPEPIHFSDTGLDRLDRAISLLGQLQQRRAGLMFLGYAMKSRKTTPDEMYSLFVHLVVDALHRLVEIGCLDEPRKLKVIKEADAGFDSIWLAKMDKQLAELIDMEFRGRLDVQPVEPVPKGQHVLLECADLIAGGMQRRALYKGRNPKDRLADAVFTVTGFEDPDDDSVLFKSFPAAG